MLCFRPTAGGPYRYLPGNVACDMDRVDQQVQPVKQEDWSGQGSTIGFEELSIL